MADPIQNQPEDGEGPVLAVLGDLRLVTERHQGRMCLAVCGHGARLLARAHAAITSPRVPALLTYDDRKERALLDCAPAATLAEALAVMAPRSVPYEQAIALTLTIAEALAAAHDVGQTLGTLAPQNLVLDGQGRLWLVGFGAPRTAWSRHASLAPPVAAGRAATPRTDVYAGLLFMRSLLPWAAGIPPLLDRILAGEAGRTERALQAILGRALTLAGPGDGRAAVAALRRYWRILGVAPDEAGLASRLAGTFARCRITLGPDAAWFRLEAGPRVDLLRRQALRRVLLQLVRSAPAPCGLAQLVAAGWPGETLVGSSGPDRLYVVLSTLRSLGLRDCLVRTATGYGLAPHVAVCWGDTEVG